MNTKFLTLIRTAALTVVAGLCGLPVAGATTVDLANTPMVTGVAKVIPPNIYFILDDSGSMGSDYMPDDVGDNDTSNCFRNWGYNRIYFNPGVTYIPPKNADGTSFANADYNNVLDDGFDTGSGYSDLAKTYTTLNNNPYTATNGSKNIVVSHSGHGLTVGTVVNLSPSRTFRGVTIGGNYSITAVTTNTYTIQAANNATSNGTGGSNNIVETSPVVRGYYYNYASNPTSPPSTCASNGSYTKVTPSTATEKTNYANWYQYYRTRIMMMKSATGRAFTTIDDKYRVGFSTISEKATGSSKFLNVTKYTCCASTTQKYKFYEKLYAASTGSTTPLRGALSKAGRLYAGRLTGANGTANPVQYSCQQNFTILTTDGYWNTSDESTGNSTQYNTSNYSAYRADNVTSIGNWDKQTLPAATTEGETTTVRPYLEPNTASYTNTLADIAAYYYRNDLYPASGSGIVTQGGYLDDGVTRLDPRSNNVPTAGSDLATWQHMTTYTVGLGVAGNLQYREDYLTCSASEATCDYGKILQGTKDWPDPQTSSSSNTVTTRIDDLWHAAVNGHGAYLSASNPDSVVTALQKTLAAISIKNASAAAAATSSLEPVAGDNFAYVAQYTTGFWYGDLQARDIDLSTGTLSATVSWSAKTQLQGKVSTASDTRTIYTYSSAASNKLKTFVSANLASEKSANYFKSSSSNPNGALSQYVLLTATEQGQATDDNMINFIRGQSGYENEAGNTYKLFRDRQYALGDIVDASPVFVKKPPFKYTDAGYASFVTTNASRTAMVYVGANDGMLHAFNAATGAEVWSYIPSMVIPYLYKLADASYANNHRFYVDGQITIGDAYDGTNWKTILIGGLGGGGKGFYALDITNPSSPKALWEFNESSDGDMGYSYGNPILTKRNSDGKWVVLVTSGYNNTGGDSKGRLFVLDAFTGSRLSEIKTDNAVTDPNVSGIGKINNYVLSTLTDNTTQYVYGGDLGGSLWRFDIDDESSVKLGKTSSTTGNQPITVKPELARIRDTSGTYYRVVYFGTGRFLGLSDVSVSAPSITVAQGIYAVKDTGGDLGVLTQSAANLQAQTLDSSVTPRTIPTPVAVDWGSKNGWYVTLPVGELVNIDLKLQLGTLVVLTNEPNDDYCSVGGRSWLYSLGYRSGASVVSGSTAVGQLAGNSIASGVTMIRLPNNKLVALVTLADTTVKPFNPGVESGVGVGIRRVSWRELN